ncbi:hypothetical protein S83_047264, partial [Arachis hypogaea]
VLVFTDISLEKAIEFNDFCHTHQLSIAFIKTEVRVGSHVVYFPQGEVSNMFQLKIFSGWLIFLTVLRHSYLITNPDAEVASCRNLASKGFSRTLSPSIAKLKYLVS